MQCSTNMLWKWEMGDKKGGLGKRKGRNILSVILSLLEYLDVVKIINAFMQSEVCFLANKPIHALLLYLVHQYVSSGKLNSYSMISLHIYFRQQQPSILREEEKVGTSDRTIFYASSFFIFRQFSTLRTRRQRFFFFFSRSRVRYLIGFSSHYIMEIQGLRSRNEIRRDKKAMADKKAGTLSHDHVRQRYTMLAIHTWSRKVWCETTQRRYFEEIMIRAFIEDIGHEKRSLKK